MSEEKSSSIGTMIVVAIAAGLIGYVIGKPAPPQVQAKAPDTSEKSSEPEKPTETKPSITPDSLKEGLVAYYPFNGNAKDESGNGHDGTVNGATLTVDRNGKPRQAFAFNGTGQHIIATGDWPQGKAPRTLSFWEKLEDPKGADNFICWGTKVKGQAFGAYVQQGEFVFYGQADDRGTTVETDAEWHHHCIVHDGATITYYIDSKKARSFDASAHNTQGRKLVIGARIDLQWPLKGSIDDVRIYNRALSPQEIKALP
jgi:hypothetical protein